MGTPTKSSVRSNELFEQFSSYEMSCLKSSVRSNELFEQLSSCEMSCLEKLSSLK